MNTENNSAIQEVIARFANSFDLKDWSRLQSCFTDTLDTDYSDLRGTPPQKLSADAYVAARREALDHLILHHLVGNYEIEFLGDREAICRASMIIWRKSETEKFSSHCVYEFRMTNQTSWKISGIRQKILWNEGTPSLHGGAKE